MSAAAASSVGPHRHRAPVGGFTLIEVLVALIIVALGIAAVMSALLSSASATDRLRERAFAEWVAANRLVETRVAEEFPSLGRSTGVASMGGRDWEWRQQVQRTSIDGVVQIVVEVRPADTASADGWLVTLQGARSRDLVVGGSADAAWDNAVRAAP
jgi:general secretion pathway protein I